MCQELPKERWIDRQKEDLLDAPYFHVVFTLPEELNALIYSNQKVLYDLLYQAASETITELSADPEHLGAKVGFLSVLHTWGSSMMFHPQSASDCAGRRAYTGRTLERERSRILPSNQSDFKGISWKIPKWTEGIKADRTIGILR
jgi:hypothetical protein